MTLNDYLIISENFSGLVVLRSPETYVGVETMERFTV